MTGSKQPLNFFKYIWILIFCACTTPGYHLKEVGYPIESIQKVISESLPTEVGYTSTNGREYYTKVFKSSTANNLEIPLIMRVIILGDRRPYDLSFEVNQVDSMKLNLEDAFDSGSKYFGSESLSKRTASKIQAELVKRHKTRNMFDDFRPF